MKRAALFACLIMSLLAAAGPAAADDAAALAAFDAGVEQRAGAAEARPHFREAARHMAGSIAADGETPARRRFEGHAWLLAGDLPRAILAYRRGLALDPDDAAMRDGLAIARSRVAGDDLSDPASAERRGALPVVAWLLRRWGLLLVLLGNIGAWASLGCWLVSRRRRWLGSAALLLALTALTAGAGIAEHIQRDARNARTFAVVATPATLRRGDGPSFLPRRDGTLPAGLELMILQDRGDWLQVELADGVMGWLPRTALLISTDEP